MRNFLFVLCTAGMITTASAAEQAAEPDTSGIQQMLDSLGLSKNDLEAKVRSTLMFGGSSPVSFSGEARLRLQYHHFKDCGSYLSQDKSYLQSNWEGNESFVRLGMVARAGRNTVLWSKIGFQHVLPGTFMKKKTSSQASESDDGFIPIDYPHDKAAKSAIIHEDMSAGIAIRTVPASFWLKLGAVHWIEASPLSIWKSQPRNFAWEYLPFEVEQPIARYYEYNIAKGEKSGRAAWNKKAFQGINLESIKLPADLYLNLFYGAYERYDNFEREFADLGADHGYSAEAAVFLKGAGIGDHFRRVFHGRLAAIELFNKLTPGINFLKYNYNEDVINASKFKDGFSVWLPSGNSVTRKNFDINNTGSKAYFKEPWVASIDLRGPISDKFSIHTDFALSRIDSSIYTAVLDTLVKSGDTSFEKNIRKSENSSSVIPAFYAHMENGYLLPFHLDLAVIGKGFYSPLSFATPVDGFFPFGANLLGPGKFIGRGEASPYTQNMAGINLKIIPEMKGYGHFRITYGQHFQLKSARDVLYFPYRLNGQDLFSFFHSSYNRWGNDLVDHCFTDVNNKYKKRLGDESFLRGDGNSVSFEGGGLRSDYLAMFESFVPYQNEIEANANLKVSDKRDVYGFGNQTDGTFMYTYLDSSTGNRDTIRSKDAFVPKHQKFTFNFEVDYGYDMSKLFGYPRDMFFSVYAAFNGVSTTFKPLVFNEKNKDMLLWGTYIRFEPAIALTNKFYLLGLAGFERWASDKAYADNGDGVAVKTPIDYRDYAIGIGFDWDMLARVGLHGRVKLIEHDDINIPSNNYRTPVVSTEIKMWF